MTGMGELTRHSGALRRAFGVVALLGLFAMHGLATHGTGHDTHTGVPMAAAHSVSQDVSGSWMTMDSAMNVPGVSEAPSAPASQDGLLALTGMCLAVLLVWVIVAVLHGRGLALTPNHRGACPSSVAPARSRRDRDPPCLLALSIQRC